MASPQEMAAYYEGFPDPDDPSTWGTNATGQACGSFAEAKAAVEAVKGKPPEPPTIPGPPSPGAGMPAARLTDLCAHGGVITAPGDPTVMIGFLPAARVTDMAVCPMFDVLVPHVSGLILKGSNTVLIGGLPAARVSDPIGPPANCKGNAIALGCFTVLIGDQGGGGGGGAASAAVTAAAAAAAKKVEASKTEAQARSAAAALVQAAAMGAPLIEINRSCGGVEPKKSRVEFRVVDEDSGEPQPGIKLIIKLPDGEEETHTTDGDGNVVIDDLEEPGKCDVRCEIKGATSEDTLDFEKLESGSI